MKQKRERIYLLDELRGFAVLCMVVHHAFLDVGYVLGLSWGYMAFEKLCVFQPIFWAIFIVISGICSRLSRNTVKRGLIVMVFGGIVTLVTAVIMPAMGMYEAEIFFGVLSCLGSCMVLTGILMPLIKKTNTTFGLIVSAVLFFVLYGVSDGKILFGTVNLPPFLYQYDLLAPFGFHSDGFISADYFPLIPWFFMFLFGAFLGKFVVEGQIPKACCKQHSRFLCLVGKNSLWIYLAHQPVLFGLFYLISILIK